MKPSSTSRALLVLATAAVLVGCSKPQPSVTSGDEGVGPAGGTVTATTSAAPASATPTAVADDPIGGQACVAIKPWWGSRQPLDMAAVDAAAKLGAGAKNPSIRARAGEVVDAVATHRKQPAAIKESDVRAWVDGFGQECLQRGYYGDV